MTVHVDGTEPYAWPYDGRLGGEHLAFVLAGWDDGWAARAVPAPGPDLCIAALASAVAAMGGAVIGLAHAGSRSLPDPAPDLDLITVAAPGIDGFYASPLDDLLRTQRRTHLLLAGHGIEAAVHSTMRSANDRGYECLLVLDACTALTDDLSTASAKQVTMSGGIFGAIGETGPVLDALSTSAPFLVPTSPQEARP